MLTKAAKPGATLRDAAEVEDVQAASVQIKRYWVKGYGSKPSGVQSAGDWTKEVLHVTN